MSDAKNQQAEPSMEEILASIRRIISEDSDAGKGQPAAPAPSAAAPAAPTESAVPQAGVPTEVSARLELLPKAPERPAAPFRHPNPRK
jgi:cell pole-organizing protein PopZ